MQGTTWLSNVSTGDTNCDGFVNLVDAERLLKFSIGLKVFDENESCQSFNTVFITSNSTDKYICDGVSDQIDINKALSEVASDESLTTVYLKGPMECVIDEPIIMHSNTKLLGDSNVLLRVKNNVNWVENKPMITQDGGQHWIDDLVTQIYGDSDDSIENIEIAGFKMTAGNQQGVSDGGWYYILMIFYRC